jgi:transcription antitermination factor NusG
VNVAGQPLMRQTKNSIDLKGNSELLSSFCEPFWYAVYMSSKREKRVADQLAQRSVEHFLPLYDTVRRWKDRRVELKLPLFPGYIFVRIALKDRLNVLKVPGVVRILGVNGIPTQVPRDQVESLQAALRDGLRAEPHPNLKAGRRVRIKVGPLAGWRGVIVRRKGAMRIVVSADLIQRSIIMDIDASALEPLDDGLRSNHLKVAADDRGSCVGNTATKRECITGSDVGMPSVVVQANLAS